MLPNPRSAQGLAIYAAEQGADMGLQFAPVISASARTQELAPYIFRSYEAAS